MKRRPLFRESDEISEVCVITRADDQCVQVIGHEAVDDDGERTVAARRTQLTGNERDERSFAEVRTSIPRANRQEDRRTSDVCAIGETSWMPHIW
jgi:hypothetical protein